MFTINLEVIDEIDHLINVKEDKIAAYIKENAVAYEHKIMPYISETKGQMEIFIKLYEILKREFNFTKLILHCKRVADNYESKYGTPLVKFFETFEVLKRGEKTPIEGMTMTEDGFDAMATFYHYSKPPDRRKTGGGY